MTTAAATPKTLSSKMNTAVYIFLGIIIFTIHVIILLYNTNLFNIIICLYVTAYAIIILIIAYKNKTCFETTGYNFVLNFSLYTIVLEILLMIFSIIMLAVKNNQRFKPY